MGIHPHYPHGTPIISTSQSPSKHFFFWLQCKRERKEQKERKKKTTQKGSKHI